MARQGGKRSTGRSSLLSYGPVTRRRKRDARPGVWGEGQATWPGAGNPFVMRLHDYQRFQRGRSSAGALNTSPFVPVNQRSFPMCCATEAVLTLV